MHHHIPKPILSNHNFIFVSSTIGAAELEWIEGVNGGLYYFICKNCNVIIGCLDNYDGYKYFEMGQLVRENPVEFTGAKLIHKSLSCEEYMIKNIIE